MRIGTLSVVAVSLLTAACGTTDNERAVTGGLGGAVVGALVGGPVGALVGGGLGATGGYALDEGADQKVSRLGDTFVNRPLADATGSRTTPSATPTRTERSGAAETAQPMTAAKVHDSIHEAGYDRVYNIRREGNAYVARAERGGKVFDVEADATTGRVVAANEVGQRATHRTSSGESTRSATTRSSADGMMSEQQIRSRLRQAGYSQVTSVQRQGDDYQAQARWGNATYDVRVEGRSGRVISSNQSSSSSGSQGSGTAPQSGSQSGIGASTGSQTAAMSEGQIRNALQTEGYSQISNLRREGAAYTAQAQRNGQSMTVRIDAQSGRILEAMPTTGGANQAPQPRQGGQNQGG